MNREISSRPLSRREVLQIGALTAAGMATGAVVEYLSPFASMPLPENWNEKVEIQTTLPENLRGVSLNAFSVWKYDKKTWDTLFKMMDETGANIVRISSLANGHFKKEDQKPEDLAQIKKFLSYFRENAMNGNKGRNFSVNFDFYDGYYLFQKGKYNGGTYSEKPHKSAEKKVKQMDEYSAYYDAREEKFPRDTSPVKIDERFLAQCAFYDSDEIKKGFKESLDLYLNELIPFRDVITAFTLANELAPVNVVTNQEDPLTAIAKSITSEKLFNAWNEEMINHIRNEFRYEDQSYEDRPIILGNADPTIINEQLFYKFKNVVLSVHDYPGNLLLMRKVRNLLKTTALPVIFQEGNVPDKLNKNALLPFLDFNPENPEIDLNEDELAFEMFQKIIELATIDGELRIGHFGFWGAGAHHQDNFRIMPDRQPLTTGLMRDLSVLLKPQKDILYEPEYVKAAPFDDLFPRYQLIFSPA